MLQTFNSAAALSDERAEIAAMLRNTVASMNPDSFQARPQLELVERFSSLAAWETVPLADLVALNERVAKLSD